MKRSNILFVIAFFICLAYNSSSLAQNYLKKLEHISIIDGRQKNLFDSVHVKLNDSKIQSVLFYVKNQQYPVSYTYNDKNLVSSVEKGNHMYQFQYDEQGRLITLKDNIIDGARTVTHNYTYTDKQIEETVTGGNFPYTTIFSVTGKEITQIRIIRPENFPAPMREEIAYELSYEKDNLVKVLKTKENKYTETPRSEDYTLTFDYDKKKSLFAQLNASLFGNHAKTTALLLNSISFYNNSWEPYNIGFDMAGKNNILSMTTVIKGSQEYYPYTVSYEYNRNKTMKKITKTINHNGQTEYEYYLFKYKK